MSSYYDDASLMLLASGGAQKDGKVYSVKPTDGSGDFTFTRGSNLAATRVSAGPNFYIEKGRENLLLQSNSFNATWAKANGATETGGQSGYDGSSDAWLLSKPAGGFVNINQDISISGVVTYSVYLKAGTNSTAIVRALGSTDNQLFVDLSNGTITFASAPIIDYVIEDIGGGWYRTSISVNDSGSVRFFIYPEAPFGNTTAGNIYIQDAQVEVGLAATEYIESGATTGTAGILEDTPRFDYSGMVTCPSLLLEPQRTNIVSQSEYMVDFIKSSATSLTANTGVSPEGKNNATYFHCNTTTTNAYINQGWVGTSGVQYSVSFYAKAKELNLIYIKNVNDSGAQSYFDLSNGTFTLLSGIDSMSIKDVGDGWYRCTAVSTSTSTYIQWIPIIRGDANEGVYVYGLQLEEGAYPTSYIPTYGTSVTRAAETSYASNQYQQIGQTEGTIFAEFTLDENASLHRLSLSDNTLNNWIFISIPENANETRMYVRIGASTNIDVQTNANVFNEGEVNKVAFAYKSGDTRVYVNGNSVLSSSSSFGLPTSELDVFVLTGSSGTGSASITNMTNNIKQATLFKTRLSNLDLAILTGATTYNTFAEMAVALNYTVYE